MQTQSGFNLARRTTRPVESPMFDSRYIERLGAARPMFKSTLPIILSDCSMRCSGIGCAALISSTMYARRRSLAC